MKAAESLDVVSHDGGGVDRLAGVDGAPRRLDGRPAGLDNEYRRETNAVDTRRERVDRGKIAKRHGSKDYRAG